MRKLIYTVSIIALICMLFVPAVDAGRKVKKSGKVIDNVFTDSKYSFNITLNEEWKAKTQKAANSARLIITQKNFAVPTDYINAPDYTKVPRIAIYADTTSMDIGAFIDSLASDTYESDQKKDVLREFEILYEPELVPQDKKRFKVAGKKAYSWKARAMYTKEVATSASSMGGKRVKGSYGGAIIGVKKDDLVVLFHVICEWQYFKDIYSTTVLFANSIQWAETGD